MTTPNGGHSAQSVGDPAQGLDGASAVRRRRRFSLADFFIGLVVPVLPLFVLIDCGALSPHWGRRAGTIVPRTGSTGEVRGQPLQPNVTREEFPPLKIEPKPGPKFYPVKNKKLKARYATAN